MDNWQKIIQGYAKPADSSTVKYIDATVTNVRDSEMHWADVKLITGQEVINLPNKSSEKLYAGRNVMVGYRTVPSKGWIAMASGETDPLKSGGGGVEVETAALLDEDNVHDRLADQELILDIDATTKLLYGGNQRLVSVQGHVCRYGTGVDLYVDDVDNFGSKLELDVWWREDANSTYVQRHMVFEMFVNMISLDSDGTLRWSLGLVVYCYDPASQPSPVSGQTAEWTQEFSTPNIAIPQPEHGTLQVKPIIIPTVTGMSFADTFSTTWSRVTESVSTPYGYCVCNNLRIYYGIWSNGMPLLQPITISRWRTSGGEILLDACGYNKNPTYKCVPMESLAEKCFNLGLTQRSEPVVPNAGGGGNA